MTSSEDKFKPGDLVRLRQDWVHSMEWNAPHVVRSAIGVVIKKEVPFVDPPESEATYEVHWLGSNARRKFNFHYELEIVQKGQDDD